MNSETQTFDYWIDELHKMSFQDRRLEIAHCIAKDTCFDEESKKVWLETVDYVENLIKKDKLFDITLYKNWLDINGHKPLDGDQMTIIMTLLALCGYNLEELKK